MKNNKANKKRISYIDEEKKTLVECDLVMRKDITSIDIDYFCKSIYGMKLESSLHQKPILRQKVTISDVVEEFQRLLDPSTYIVDFKRMSSLFRPSQLGQQTPIGYSIQKFFGFFQLEKKSEFPMDMIEVMDTFSRHPNFIGNEGMMIQREISSLKYNTQILNQQILKKTPQQRKRNLYKVKEK